MIIYVIDQCHVIDNDEFMKYNGKQMCSGSVGLFCNKHNFAYSAQQFNYTCDYLVY